MEYRFAPLVHRRQPGGEKIMMRSLARSRGRLPIALIPALCALLALTLAGCATGSPTANHPGATATPPATATPKILYQADWSGSASQWSLAPGWRLSPTGLANDGSSATSVYLPYTPSASSYTIEMVIQLNAVLGPVACGNEFGLEALTAAGATVYFAGITCVEHNFHTFADLYSETDAGQFRTSDYTPGRNPRVYDVVVDGAYVTYVMNGAELGAIKCDLPTAPNRLLLLNTGLQTEIQRITITTP
jgi:hypothetical protein